jgi:4-cresol dehydrogenase (hydroxylating)
MAVLPLGVSSGDFAAAVAQFAAAVGTDWVFTSDEDLRPYRDHYSPVPLAADELIASAAVSPTTVEQVQAIVRTANQYKIPLYPISTGKNFAYGGPAPNLRGSVVVDLKRMDKVIEVDADRHFAIVEPGVSYFDLYRHIQERGLKVWIDTPDPGWGSPVGNTLERGIGYTLGPYRDHTGAQHGFEVVLANGEVLRTGMGAVPNAKSFAEYKYGFGPDPSGLFAQGNFGIVTKMGLRLMPQPEHWRTGLVTVPKRRDFIPLVKTVNYLTDLFMIGEPWYGSPLRALLGNTEFREAATRRDGANEAELDRFAAAANLHSWPPRARSPGSHRAATAPRARRSRAARGNGGRRPTRSAPPAAAPAARGARSPRGSVPAPPVASGRARIRTRGTETIGTRSPIPAARERRETPTASSSRGCRSARR